MLTPQRKHYGMYRCKICDTFNGWIPKPDSDASKYKRPQKHRSLVNKFSRGFCESCLRLEGELPDGQVLEAQHVVPYQQGGKPERDNVWILCTGCHRLIEHQRTYVGHKTLIESVAKALTEWKDG